MFRRVRADTLVRSIEERYQVSLNARGDMKLANLLAQRRFDSLSQLLRAYRGQLESHAAPRSVFLSFHREDLGQVNGFRLMMQNERLDLQISDEPTRYPVGSEHSSYIKQVLRRRIASADVVICMIGNGTAWRDWVDWELATALEAHRGLCGVRLKGSRGRVPDQLRAANAPVASWDLSRIVATIECAVARGS
jgi:hypothetical protein